MKIQKFNNISFEKKLKANCSILQNGIPAQGRIYELNTLIDGDYFNFPSNKQGWVYAKRWFESKREFATFYKNEEIYTLENEKENCLGFINIHNDEQELKKELLLFETAPKSREEYKYIGETLLSYIIGLAKKDSFQAVCVPVWKKNAEDFYIKKCGFEYPEAGEYGLKLNASKFNSFIEQNKNHTKYGINYIA